MVVEIKKTLLGKYLVIYECPGCKETLRSPKNEIGQADICPTCQAQFIVPGAKELQKFLKREDAAAEQKAQKAAENAANREKQRTRKEQERAAKEELRAEKEKDRLRIAEVQERRRMDQLELRIPPASQPPLPVASTDTKRRCPYCSEEILASAMKCKHCGEFLDGRKRTQSPQIVVQPAQQGMSGCTLVMVIAFGIMAAVIMMAFL